MSHRSPPVVMLVLLATASWACSDAPDDERAALCEDLGSLEATVDVIANPPIDATVGDVRGATDKLDPTIEQAEDASIVPDAESDGLRAGQEAVLDAIDGISDDTSVLELPPDRLAPTDDLVASYRNIVVSLGCSSEGS